MLAPPLRCYMELQRAGRFYLLQYEPCLYFVEPSHLCAIMISLIQ